MVVVYVEQKDETEEVLAANSRYKLYCFQEDKAVETRARWIRTKDITDSCMSSNQWSRMKMDSKSSEQALRQTASSKRVSMSIL